MENIEKDAWDQLEGEPLDWYRKFNIYRLIGMTRSLAKAHRNWRQADGKVADKTARAGAAWFQMAKEWNWTERAEAWDEAQRQSLEEDATRIYGSGLSLAHERVDKLKQIAQKLEDFILDKKTTRISPFVIEQYRGILDDIAKERGERLKETRITGATGGAIMIETSWGRGGAASEAWKQVEAPLETVIEEITDTTQE